MSPSRGSSGPRDRAHSSCVGRRFFTPEPPGEPVMPAAGPPVQWRVFLLALSSLLACDTHIPTQLHAHAHASTHLHPPSLPLHAHVRPLSEKPSSPANSTCISNLHSLCPQPECISCFFFIPIKFPIRRFNTLAGLSIPFRFPGDSLLEPWALLDLLLLILPA